MHIIFLHLHINIDHMDCVFAYYIHHLLSYSTYICIPGFHLVGADLLFRP